LVSLQLLDVFKIVSDFLHLVLVQIGGCKFCFKVL
jgi:hypothetical protein